MWIINQQIRDLVALIDASVSGEALDRLLVELVSLLQERCALPEITSRYAAYAESKSEIAQLPVDAEGYIIGFDPLTQEEQFVESWQQFGIVVGLNVVSPEICAQTIARMGELVLGASDGKCDLGKP